MAVKGKRKSQSRGSQGRRRPATMPRTGGPVARTVPWHRTNQGRITVALVIALVVGAVGWAVASTRDRNARQERRQQALDTYTDRVEAVLQSIDAPATGMMSLPPAPDPATTTALANDARSWSNALAEAQAQVSVLPPTRGVEQANQVFAQSVLLLDSTAQTFALVPRADRDVGPQIYARAIAQRDRAIALWTTGVALVDEELVAAGAELSEIGTPGADATPPAP